MRTLIWTLLTTFLLSCGNPPALTDQLVDSNDTTVTISKENYAKLILLKQLMKEDSIRNSADYEDISEQYADEYIEPSNDQQYDRTTFTFENEIKMNKTGIYIVPEGKMWDIKIATGVNPLHDSAGTFEIECGGYLNVEESHDHECGVVTNVMTGEKFKSDERQTVWYYVNSYQHLFLKEGHKMEYTSGSSNEVLHIDQYIIHKP